MEVQRALRDARLRIDPEIEVQTLVDVANAYDFVHPGLRKGPVLLIMSTRRSAKVSNDCGSGWHRGRRRLSRVRRSGQPEQRDHRGRGADQGGRQEEDAGDLKD